MRLFDSCVSAARLRASRVTTQLFALGMLAVPAMAGAQSPDTVAKGATADSAVRWVEIDLHSDSTPVAQLAAAVRAARHEGRTPIVELGAPWCGPCHAIKAILQKPDMATTMQKMYVISLNNDNWKQALLNLGFDAGSGIPRFFVIDSTGHDVGEPWRPRDMPSDVVSKLGTEGAVRTTVTDFFTKAQKQYAKNK